jgi:hypothetical protein
MRAFRFILTSLLTAAICGPTALRAQAPGRLSVTPFLGYTQTSPVFDHKVHIVEGSASFHEQTRVALDAAATAGMRVGFAVGQRWTAHAEAAYGGTEFEFREYSVAQSGDLVGTAEYESVYRSEASVTTFGVAVGRRFRPVSGAAEMELSLGGGLQRLRLERPNCEPLPPSMGFATTCGPLFGGGSPRWDRVYHVPSLSGAAGLRVPLRQRIGAEVRAGYLVGRANTESFHVDLIPELDRYEAPRQTRVGLVQLTAGLSWRL